VAFGIISRPSIQQRFFGIREKKKDPGRTFRRSGIKETELIEAENLRTS
jgi:hypothetical protein